MKHQGPRLTVDIIIEISPGDIALIKRKYPPPGWAIPGGFVEFGETLEAAAKREAWEETGLSVFLQDILWVYSDPARDPRGHTVSAVFTASGSGKMQAADDAAEVAVFSQGNLPTPLAFDHARILADYFVFKRTGARPSAAKDERDGG